MKQRAGYQDFSDEETWSLDVEIAKFIAPRLRRYREVSKCHPAHMKPSEWRKVLDKMIRGFDLIVKENAEYNRLTKREHRQVAQGLDAFREHYRRLWW